MRLKNVTTKCEICKQLVTNKIAGQMGYFDTSFGRKFYHKICEIKRRLKSAKFKFTDEEIEELWEIFINV